MGDRERALREILKAYAVEPGGWFVTYVSIDVCEGLAKAKAMRDEALARLRRGFTTSDCEAGYCDLPVAVALQGLFAAELTGLPVSPPVYVEGIGRGAVLRAWGESLIAQARAVFPDVVYV